MLDRIIDESYPDVVRRVVGPLALARLAVNAVYRFAPLEMSNAQRASIHGVDERVEIASLERGEMFHRALLERLQ